MIIRHLQSGIHDGINQQEVMMKRFYGLVWIILIGFLFPTYSQQKADPMTWWRDARFGLFIHWGLYAIPAGEWNGVTTYAEWIRTNAQIPLDTYDQFVNQFNPIKFDAEAWVRMAKEAGMKYIVITSKHHDGFCLFDSKYTDFDVMSTPFKRDIMKELADAAHAEGIKICWYHSIMDWHHPDYLPRRDWEVNRSSEDADYERFVTYLKNQLKELVNNYGDIGVLWFDGEWEETWTPERGWEIYRYIKTMDPDLIVNNRVGKGRAGMSGYTQKGEFAGDFGTPEQEIPATGWPGVDWETCMTMNDHWGWNKNDHNWKSAEDLLKKLADIASKGGNFLLNVGPRPDGTFPDEAVDRLSAMGAWMNKNGESIYGTQASPFPSLPWGRCTQKTIPEGTRLYLHVFEWPESGELRIPGISNDASSAYLLSAPESELTVTRSRDALIISVPKVAPDSVNTVVVLNVKGKPDIHVPPEIKADSPVFLDSIEVRLVSERENIEIRYTLDGQTVTTQSPLYVDPLWITKTTTVRTKAFCQGEPVSDTNAARFKRVTPLGAAQDLELKPGIRYKYYTGEWLALPDFDSLVPARSDVLETITIGPAEDPDYYGFVYTGYIRVPETAVYTFYCDSDDGSRLTIDDCVVVQNDGLHGLVEKEGLIALEEGLHLIRVDFFERTGGSGLTVSMKRPGMKKRKLGEGMLFYKE
jgi:alpha-L-fucosidase